MKKGVAMVLCRSMGPVSSKDELTRRSVAAKCSTWSQMRYYN